MFEDLNFIFVSFQLLFQVLYCVFQFLILQVVWLSVQTAVISIMDTALVNLPFINWARSIRAFEVFTINFPFYWSLLLVVVWIICAGDAILWAWSWFYNDVLTKCTCQSWLINPAPLLNSAHVWSIRCRHILILDLSLNLWFWHFLMNIWSRIVYFASGLFLFFSFVFLSLLIIYFSL